MKFLLTAVLFCCQAGGLLATGTCEAKHTKESKQCSALRRNDRVVIMNRPCRIVEISTKTGKDGQSEVHITCIDIFTQKKLDDNCPPNDFRDVPNIERKDYILADVNDEGFLSLLDPDTGDFRDDLPLPVDPDLSGEIKQANFDSKDILCIVLSACGEEAVVGTKNDEPW